MNITKATVILTFGTDLVILETDKPSPVPCVTQESLEIMFYVECNKGEEYVKTNFPNVPITVVPRI